MTKRQALITLFAVPLASWKTVKAADPAKLMINLSEWSSIVVRFGTKTVELRSKDIFDALRKG